MRRWSFWEWVAYGALFVAAMIIAADTGIRIAPEMAGYIPAFVHGAIWGLAPLVLVVVATVVLLFREFVSRPQKEMVGTPQPIPTSVRLQFHPNSIIPTNLHSENVWRWYSMCSIFNVIEQPNKKTKQAVQHERRIWSIFIIFDKPVAFKQILVDGNGTTLPLTEIKDSGPRHAIVVISGDIGAAVIDVRLVV